MSPILREQMHFDFSSSRLIQPCTRRGRRQLKWGWDWVTGRRGSSDHRSLPHWAVSVGCYPAAAEWDDAAIWTLPAVDFPPKPMGAHSATSHPTGDTPIPQPNRPVGNRFTYPGARRLIGWVGLGVVYIQGWFTCLQTVTHPSSKHLIAIWPTVEPTISWSQVQCTNRYTTIHITGIARQSIGWSVCYVYIGS